VGEHKVLIEKGVFVTVPPIEHPPCRLASLLSNRKLPGSNLGPQVEHSKVFLWLFQYLE
jgi:hypothetical protein